MKQNFPNRSHVFCVFCQMCNFIASNKCETKTKVKHLKHLKHQAKASEMPNHAKRHASERVPQKRTRPLGDNAPQCRASESVA